MSVYTYLWCEECKEHFHLGKLKSGTSEHKGYITDETRGLTLEFLYRHLRHKVLVCTEFDDYPFGHKDFGVVWDGD